MPLWRILINYDQWLMMAVGPATHQVTVPCGASALAAGALGNSRASEVADCLETTAQTLLSQLKRSGHAASFQITIDCIASLRCGSVLFSCLPVIPLSSYLSIWLREHGREPACFRSLLILRAPVALDLWLLRLKLQIRSLKPHGAH